MADDRKPEIVLCDLACNKNRIPYRTVFVDFQDIEPTLKGLGLSPHKSVSPGEPKYTVPAIHHVPTNKHIVDSVAIAHFLESVYPDPPLPLESSLGQEVELKTRRVIGAVYKTSLTPRELHILSPPTRHYFRRTREVSLGHPLEELFGGNKEDKVWDAAANDIHAVGEVMLTNKTKGNFLLGDKPSYTDFFIAGSLQCARMIDEDVFQRTIAFPGFGDICEACLPYITLKQD